ncbi:hypothetical protein MtrunA17_Chr3g0107221 [Medicago truncatula]|uniref:Uncharacterized protein n=1 Tax=Medicago truncatula TaxID=3880 RepID=A0A396IR87_MEDTR|nr:hypothetical protein MtrunA17_Chr3g0107221 [Medicago truncatula]
MEIWGKMDLTKEETEEGRVADKTEGCGEEIFTGEHHPLAISSTSTKRPPQEPPPRVVMIIRKRRLKLQHLSILQKTEFGLLPLELSLERPPRKPPDEVRITLLPQISSLSLGFKHCPQLRFDCNYHTSFVAFYEDESRFNPFAFYRLISVQSDKVKKSETKYSRNVRDEAKKMIRNWIEKKTLDSHISFVTFRRWKMLMNGLLGCELWSNFSYFVYKVYVYCKS